MTRHNYKKLPLQWERRRRIILMLSSVWLSLSAFPQERQELFFADPTVYVENGKYYLTGTGGHRQNLPGFSLLESNDLRIWTSAAGIKDSTCMILTRGDRTFGTKGFWAPQLFKTDSTYYLTYTADEQTVLARSRSLRGPYTQEEVAPVDASGKNIDSFVFRDDDGECYLYHVRIDGGNYLWVAAFDPTKGKIRQETLTQCFDRTEPWEATPNYASDPIMEGPTVIKLKGKYYLFYSANHFMNIDYAVGYAVSDSPYGPWIKQRDNPILHRSIVGENGSGHGDLFEGLDGRLYYVYHVHYSQSRVSPRKTRIVPMIREWDPERGHYTFRVKGDEVIVPVLK
jgi:beta-xylosidase